MDSISMLQIYALDVGVTRSQLAPSHLHLPQIDWDSSQIVPFSDDDEAKILVSMVIYPQLALGKPGSIRVAYPLILSFLPVRLPAPTLN